MLISTRPSRNHATQLDRLSDISRPTQNRLKNRFIFVFSNGDLLQVLDLNGTPEEIRTPDPQIRSLGGEHFEIARGSGSDHDFLRSPAAQQNHGP
jgi:hypothetical protein